MKAGKEIVEKLKREVEENQKKFFVPFKSNWQNEKFESQIDIEEGGSLAVKVSQADFSFKKESSLKDKNFTFLLEHIKSKITYLPENFKIVEIDKNASRAMLCSEKPLTVKDSVEYFRLMVSKDLKFILHRVRNLKHKNEIVPFVVSYEIMERLINDLVEMVDELE